MTMNAEDLIAQFGQRFEDELSNLDGVELDLDLGLDTGLEAWLGDAAKARKFTPLGQGDHSGSILAAWTATSTDVLEQPVLFFGSEGQLAILAEDVKAFLGLLATGHAPYDLAEENYQPRQQTPEMVDWVSEHIGALETGSAEEVMARARQKHSPILESLGRG